MGQCGAGAEAGARAGLAPPAPVRRDDVVRHRESTQGSGGGRGSGRRGERRTRDIFWEESGRRIRSYVYIYMAWLDSDDKVNKAGEE
jgi:hypothetical protein